MEDIKTGTIDINPIGKPRMVYSDKWKKRPTVQKYWEYCDVIRENVGEIDYKPKSVFLIAIIAMPERWSIKKKKEMIFTGHQSRPDVDNIAKGFMDAVFKEDSTIHSIAVCKLWGEKGLIKYEIR